MTRRTASTASSTKSTRRSLFRSERSKLASTHPNLVRDRIAALKAERTQIDAELAALQPKQPNGSINLDEACEILRALPDLGNALSAADTETRRGVFDAFRLSVVLDRNAHQIQVKALASSAFTKARDLQSLVTNGAIAGAGFEQTSATAYQFVEIHALG